MGGELCAVGAGAGFGPRLVCEDAAVFANDELCGAVVEDVALFAVQLAELGGDLGSDLLRAFDFVCVREGPVEVCIDYDGVAVWVAEAVLATTVPESLIEVPAVGNVDGKTGIDGFEEV